MMLAVSSFAWAPSADAEARRLLVDHGVRAIELAPLKVWPDPLAMTDASVADYRRTWNDAGIDIVALQGILFGLPGLQLFGTDAERAGFEAQLIAMAQLASRLGAKVVVLGAPKNRLRGPLSEAEAVDRSVGPLRRIGAAADDLGVCVCIEPNPPAYGGDFVRTIPEAMLLVDAVAQPGFGLHLDGGAIALEHETDDVIERAARVAQHYHISEVQLGEVGTGTVDHARIAGLLRSAGYARWHSIEMLDRGLDTLARAIGVARQSYRL